MTEGKNRQWILNTRPNGKLTGEEFRWNETSIPRPCDGQVLIRTLWLSIGTRLSELCPNGIDVFFDNVGGEVLNEVLARINLHARIVLCGSVSKSDAATLPPGPANYSNLVARRARMEGFTGLDYPARVPEAFEALGRWQRDGSLVHKEDVAYGLENAPKALLRLFAGENFGKQLVKVADAA
jgi:NADPH-dependent curcumin reductase CurA